MSEIRGIKKRIKQLEQQTQECDVGVFSQSGHHRVEPLQPRCTIERAALDVFHEQRPSPHIEVVQLQRLLREFQRFFRVFREDLLCDPDLISTVGGRLCHL